MYDAELEICGDVLDHVAALLDFEPIPEVNYFLSYRITFLPIWKKGIEPLFFWRDGKIAHAPGLIDDEDDDD